MKCFKQNDHIKCKESKPPTNVENLLWASIIFNTVEKTKMSKKGSLMSSYFCEASKQKIVVK